MIQPGSTVAGLYQIESMIGEGGGGEVYRAWHTRLQTYVVLKRIREEIVGKITSRAEADILKGLKHSYLPQIYDFVEDENGVFTVMDFVQGQPLSAVLRQQGALPQQRVIKYATQLCEAVAYLHSRRPAIIHSDIKPANIMITPEDNICLIDFNIALVFSGGGTVPIGATDGYAPPEQYSDLQMKRLLNYYSAQQRAQNATGVDTELVQTLLDEEMPTMVGGTPVATVEDPGVAMLPAGAVSPAMDIYSIGATVYHMVAGKLPPCSILQIQPLAGMKPKPVGPGLAYVVDRAMEKTPARRFASVEQMLHILRNSKAFDARYKKQRAAEVLTGIGTAVGVLAAIALMLTGVLTMRRERLDSYYSLVHQAEQVTRPADQARLEELVAQAVALLPHQAEAYRTKALYLYQTGQYDVCTSYAVQALNTLEENADNKTLLGDLYFLIAACYADQERPADALRYYQDAVRRNTENSDYYRDYAIALARTGSLDKAEDALARATALGLQDDNVSLVRGEIALTAGRYIEAEEYFTTALQNTRQEAIRLRSVQMLNRLYTQTGGQIEDAAGKNVRLLERYIPQLPLQQQAQLQEELALAYTEYGRVTEDPSQYEQALTLFRQLWDGGDKRFSVASNMAVLYVQLGRLEEAETLLLQAARQFPENYAVYKRLAYLEAEKQAAQPNENRDYAAFAEYYKQASELYAQADAQDDMEMARLDALMRDVQAGGWVGA